MSTLLLKSPRTDPARGPVREWEPLRIGRGGRVRCPLCGWEPPPAARWACSCGEIWNTFATHGVCPGCSREWGRTQCQRCQQWSRHEDWYAPAD